MPKFQRIVEATEARQLTAENVEEITAWCGGMQVREVSPTDHDDVYVGVNVPAVSGNFRVSQGEWLAKNERGVFSKYTTDQMQRLFKEV